MDKYVRVITTKFDVICDGYGDSDQQVRSEYSRDDSCDVDLIDAMEDRTAVDKALCILTDEGADEYSASDWQVRGWYNVTAYPTYDLIAEYCEKSLRLYGFSDEESRELYAQWKAANSYVRA